MVWMQNFFSSVKMLLIVCFLLSPVFSAPHKSTARNHQELIESDYKTLPDKLDENIPKVNKIFCYLMTIKLRLIMKKAMQGALIMRISEDSPLLAYFLVKFRGCKISK